MCLEEHFVAFDLIYWTPIHNEYFWGILFWKNMENMEKLPFFQVAKARNTARAAIGGLAYRVKSIRLVRRKLYHR